METAVKTITTRLNALFADMDKEVLEATHEWAKGRVAALSEFKKSEQAKEMKRGMFNSHAYYDALFSIAGGKTWYLVLEYGYSPTAQEAITKSCEMTAKKRNASIAAKLEKAGINEIISEEFTNTQDGFNGVYIVSTDKGNKKITIETIRAGGYNVQCLHLRVLVKVK